MTVVIIELSHADRGKIIMKHIKCDFRSKASIGSPGWTLVVGSKAQNSTSSEYGHVAYQIKRNHTCSNIIGNILPADPPPPPTLGV